MSYDDSCLNCLMEDETARALFTQFCTEISRSEVTVIVQKGILFLRKLGQVTEKNGFVLFLIRTVFCDDDIRC